MVEVADQHRQGVGDHLQFRFALAQRIFAGLLAADVHHRAGKAQRAALLVAVTAAARQGPACLAIGQLQSITLVEGAALGDAAFQRGTQPGRVLGMDMIEEGLATQALGARLLHREDARQLGAGRNPLAAEGPVPDADQVAGLERQLQALLARPVHLGAELVVQGGLRQAGFGAHTLAGFAEAEQQPADAVRCVADGAQGKVEPGIFRGAAALDRHALVAQQSRLASPGRIASGVQQLPGGTPATTGRLAEFGRMTITDQCGVCIVVELQCLLAPQDAHGHGRLEDGLEQQPQGRRPAVGHAEHGHAPVVPADPLAHFAVTLGPELRAYCHVASYRSSVAELRIQACGACGSRFDACRPALFLSRFPPTVTVA